MYPPHHSSSSSSSSSSQTGTGLTRYGSAPSSLLNSTVEAVLAAGGCGSRLLPPGGGGGGGAQAHYYSSSGDSASDTTCKEHNIRSSPTSYHHDAFLNSAGSASLLRQKSSPAGFLSHNHNLNAGFTITRGSSHSHSQGGGGGGSRLKSELSFTAQGQECLSRISENLVVDASTSYGTQHQPWGGQDGDNSIVFSAPPKRSKTNDPDFLTALDSQFSLPQTTLEMAAVENMLHIPQDSVPCKIRAKRGCATHPRSIAERERRTRISGKLKKLQDLVPNMDKQTSYADMLDLAVQHIKGLQGQVQKLHTELENCTCGCKQST